MYKELLADDFRKDLGLAVNFTVDGVLCHGTKSKRRHAQQLVEDLDQAGIPYDLRPLQEEGFFETVKVIQAEGKKLLFDAAYGGAYLSEFVHVACLLGSRKNVLIGSCGGLKVGVETGEIVVPVSSYGNESSTRMYQPDNEEFTYFSDPDLSDKLAHRLHTKYKVARGKIITCQGALAESWNDIRRWSDEGYTGVEMESSTLFAVSGYFQVPSAAMLMVADNLVKKQTVLDDEFKKLKVSLRQERSELFVAALQELLA